MKFSWKPYILALIISLVSFLEVKAQEEVLDGAQFPVYEIELLNEEIVDEDLIFPLVYKGYIYSFALKHKLPIWRLFIGGDIISPWIIKDDLIYFHDIYNRIYAVEIKSGTILWQLTIENEIRGKPLIYGNSLIVSTSKGLVYVINAESGDITDTYSGSGEIYAGLVLYDNLIIVPFKNGEIVAFNIEKSEIEWTFSAGDIVTVPPVIDIDILFFGGWNNSLYALDIKSGEARWVSYVGKSVTRDFLVFKNEIILFFSGGEIISLLRKDGTIKWVMYMKDVEFSYNYFAGTEKYYIFIPEFVALSPDDGSLIFNYRERAFNLYKEMLFENMIEGETPLSDEQRTEILRDIYFTVNEYPVLPPLYTEQNLIYFITEDSHLYVYDMEQDFFVLKYRIE
jgi:outer membrane protein assembly factor BamB